MLAAKKRKKKKKAATPRPASKKPHHKKASAAQKGDQVKLTARTSGYFGDLTDRISREEYSKKDWGRLALLATAMLVVLYYAFSAGGFFVEKRGYGELVILYLLVMGTIFSLRVEGSPSRLESAVIACFGGYTVWMLLSTFWSLSPAESFNEFNRGVLYLAGFLVFFLFMARREWLGWFATMFVIIVAIVAADGLLLKVIPDVMADYFNIGDLVERIMAMTGAPEETAKLQAVFIKMDAFQSNRLSYPVTYWNTMGLLMIMAVPLSLRAAADRMRPLVFRCFNAAALVLFVAVVYFTFSRAGYLLLVFVLLLYTLVSAYRLRTALHAGLLALWSAILIIITRTSLPAMIESQPTIDDRVSQGHQLGWLIVLLLIMAAAVQIIVAHFESRVDLPQKMAVKIGIALTVVAVVVPLVGFTAITASSGGPVTWVQEQLSGASSREEAVESAEERIFSVQSERYDEYGVSLSTFAANPIGGTGSGTWGIGWIKERPYNIAVKDGHSWFFDTMAEMGLIGTGLLVGFMVTFIIVALRQLRHFGLKFSRGHRSREGELYAAVFVTCAALLMHSLIDWDWEMPVVMLSFFMFAGALLRYGILARSVGGAAQDAGAGVPAPATAAVASGFRANWWVWLLGAGCIVMMVLTVLPVIAESRTKSAQEHLNQAQALVASNMKRDGQAWFEEAHKISSNARKYNALDARFLVQTGDANIGLAGIATDEATRISYYESAEEDYLEALKLQPDNFETYQRLAELYLRTSRLEKAADAVRRARELNPLDQIKTPSLEERVRVISVN